jgi:phosphate/sulfate permease
MKEQSEIKTLIHVFAVIIGIIGVYVIIEGLNGLNTGEFRRFAYIWIAVGIFIIFSGILGYGFGYVVEAACRYLYLTKDKISTSKQSKTTSVNNTQENNNESLGK